jgi:hypothetical protein
MSKIRIERIKSPRRSPRSQWPRERPSRQTLFLRVRQRHDWDEIGVEKEVRGAWKSPRLAHPRSCRHKSNNKMCLLRKSNACGRTGQDVVRTSCTPVNRTDSGEPGTCSGLRKEWLMERRKFLKDATMRSRCKFLTCMYLS